MTSKTLVVAVAALCASNAMATTESAPHGTMSDGAISALATDRLHIELSVASIQPASVGYQVVKGEGKRFRAWYEIKDRFSILFA